MKKLSRLILVFLLVLACIFTTACDEAPLERVEPDREASIPIDIPVDQAPAPAHKEEKTVGNGKATPVELSEIPEYSGEFYVAINDNIPNFSTSELTTVAYEWYSPLDTLGRCGMAIASCGKEIMPSPDEERGNISDIKPSGWVQAKYDGVSGGYLWNRCHLIGWQLSAENANEKNLITGTRSMNVDGMLLFENMVADYVKETGNHVAYRITPIYDGDELVCRGVQMEAYSIEDDGEGISFNVYCYNVQPGIVIDYATGESHAEKEITEPETASVTYVLNTNTKRVHYPSCHSVKQISEKNYAESSEALDALLSRGYKPCGNCMK